ncbi:MAG: sulfite exporter TauE/SafE family protein [Pseudomonadota bacterium]
MEPQSWLIFGCTVLFSSYLQTIAGFGMGMILMAVIGASGSIPLPILTAVVSLISFANVTLSMKGHLDSIDWRILRWLIVGQLPAIVVGVSLITLLDRDWRWILEVLLGLFITAGSASMMIKPVSRPTVSTPSACVVAGFGGGILGGLFSASGPVLGWFVYRQPLAIEVIRSTLLCFFAIATMGRTAIVGLQGGLVADVWLFTATGLPLVFMGAWLGRWLPPKLSETNLKRGVFCFLFLIGGYILTRGFLR